MSHSSSGIVLLHDPTSQRRNILRRCSLAGCVAVAAAAAVVGAAPRRMSASSVLIMSVLEDSQPEVDDSCVSVTNRCKNFSTAGTSGGGAGDSTVVSNRQSKSSS